MFSSNTHWQQLTAPFYSILFETTICQFNSSKCLMRFENTWPFLHPESLQTLYIPSSMTVLLLFSSPHSFLLQGSGQRTPDKRSETIPSSRITPDPLYSQLHDGASSLQFTSLILLQGSGQSRSLVLFSVTRFLCCFWGLCLDYCTVGRFLTESVTYWFFSLLVFDRIHDVMCLNKMSRTSSRNIGPQHQKHSSIFHCTHGVLFIPVFTKPILSVCC